MRLHRCTADTGTPWHACDCQGMAVEDVPPDASLLIVGDDIYKRERWKTRKDRPFDDGPGELFEDQPPFPGETIPPMAPGEPSWGFELWRMVHGGVGT